MDLPFHIQTTLKADFMSMENEGVINVKVCYTKEIFNNWIVSLSFPGIMGNYLPNN